MTDAFRQRLLELYAEVDDAVAAAGPKCDASGRCCRFKEWGHVLFLSAPEAELLLETAPAYQKPASPDSCPFQEDNLCTARAERPIACRIYFCDPAYQETAGEITESMLKTLKRLCDAHHVPWRYAPLHQFLNEAPERRTAPRSRVALPLTPND